MLLTLDILYNFLTLSLIVSGLSIAFGLLKVINMAHGEMVILGAYAALFCKQYNLSFFFGIPLAIFICAITAAIVYQLVIKKIKGRLIDSILATWGVSLILKQILILTFSPSAQYINAPTNETILLFDSQYPIYRMIVMAVSLVTLISIYWLFFKTQFGLNARAVISNPTLASYMGLNKDKINLASFTLSGAIAGLAGAIIAPLISFSPISGKDYLIPSFLSVLIGGLESISAPLLGSFLIATTETSSTLFLNPVIAQIITLSLAIILLKTCPNGIANTRLFITMRALFKSQSNKHSNK